MTGFEKDVRIRTMTYGITVLLTVFAVTGFMVPAGLCGSADTALTLTSSAFVSRGPIPRTYTCEGRDISPPLHWAGVPKGTRSLVLIVDDPDAPDPKAPRVTWVHWVLFNIPPDATGLCEAVSPSGLPGGTQEGLNSWHRTGYGGPCPPIGRHRYFFKLYALDTVLKGLKKPSKRDVEAGMKGHILGQAEWMGTYQKGQ